MDEKFIYNGYMYTFDVFNYDGTKQFWSCRYRLVYCSCRVHTLTEISEKTNILNSFTILNFKINYFINNLDIKDHEFPILVLYLFNYYYFILNYYFNYYLPK